MGMLVLRILILLPSTYYFRSAWEVSEQESYHPLPALKIILVFRRIAIGIIGHKTFFFSYS